MKLSAALTSSSVGSETMRTNKAVAIMTNIYVVVIDLLPANTASRHKAPPKILIQIFFP